MFDESAKFWYKLFPYSLEFMGIEPFDGVQITLPFIRAIH